MSDLRIEPATLEDMPLLAELLADLFAGSRTFIPTKPNRSAGCG